MARLSLWDKRKRNDYKFFDKVIAEQFQVGGTSLFIHKYIGIQDQGASEDATQPTQTTTNETSIQDVLFLENRDRKYDNNIYELRGIYQRPEISFDLRQFGLFLSGDSISMTVHLNTMIDSIGRKLLSGDVIELPHLKDDAVLNEINDGLQSTTAINKFYVIKDATWDSSGFAPTWYPHIWGMKLEPITDSQEFSDILDREVLSDGVLGDKKTGEDGSGDTLRDILSNFKDSIGISDAILSEAEKQVPLRNFETAHFYVIPGDEFGKQFPWIFAGDGNPPNGASLAGSGSIFPTSPLENDYFLRVDFEPNVLFQRKNSTWIRVEVDYRKKWNAAHRLLELFTNNKNITTLESGRTFDEKTPISKAVKPRADFSG